MILLLGLALVPALALADCSDGEMTAVFLVSGLYPDLVPQVELLSVAPVGTQTDPDEAEMIAAIEAVQPGYSYQHVASVADFHLFYADPVDFGACAIVDGRDGAVLFAGTVVWSGAGAVTLPDASSHDWSPSGGDPAPAPASLGILPNPEWGDGFGLPADITDATLAVLRETDVLASFAACDPYGVASYIYTPVVGLTDPSVALNVIIVSGRCGPPWNGDPVAAERTSWQRVKALFR
jgi:hypothetical protein